MEIMKENIKKIMHTEIKQIESTSENHCSFLSESPFIPSNNDLMLLISEVHIYIKN